MNIRVDAETELRYRYSMTEDLGAMQLTNGIKTMRETREQYLIRFFPTIEGKITIDSKIETSDTIYYDLVNGQRQNERKSFSQSDERAFAVVRQNTTPMAEPTTITIGTGTSNSDPPSRHFRAIIKSNGELVSIENEIDLYRQIFGEKVAQMAALPEDNFSRISYMSDYEPLLEEFVSQHFRPFFSMYPLQSVRAGESWITRKPVLTRTSYQLHGYSFKSRVQPMWMLKEIGQNLKLSYLSEWDVYPPNAVAKQIMKEDGYALLDPKTSLLKELKINMLTKTGAGKESSLVPSLTFEVQQL
ncbi:MAG: hypothetical protein CVV27_13585 [Candidatus Melainabacteria bacterium HGW-Melainabacteria-1]|nr:MAG: hypothetical protein CVV27_13585 [Candidatus Melainabacteria bacterium HGW-Melainabacteria-1]